MIFLPKNPPVVHSTKKIQWDPEFTANSSKILIEQDISKEFSRDLSKDKKEQALQDKILDLEQRDIQRSKELEDQRLGMKHKEIAIRHEEKHLKQQLVFLQQKLEEKEKELKSQFNDMQASRLELNQEIKRSQQKDVLLKKQEAMLLDKDRQIMELNKQLGKATTQIDCLRLEMRDLKKYNIEELQKQEKVFSEKYNQLRDLVGEHKLKMTEFQKTVRQQPVNSEKQAPEPPQPAPKPQISKGSLLKNQENLKSTISHPNTERANQPNHQKTSDHPKPDPVLTKQKRHLNEQSQNNMSELLS